MASGLTPREVTGKFKTIQVVDVLLRPRRFIRAPSVVLGSTIRGADNLQAASAGGAAAPMSAPVPAVVPPPSATATESRSAEAQAENRQSEESRTRNSLLTVDLPGLGPAPFDENCSDADAAAGRCVKTAKP